MALLDFDTVRELNKRGLRIIQAWDRRCYHVEFCGVNFDIADEELALCRNNEQILEIIRWKYRNIGGAMKTVQLYVSVAKNSLSACQYVEAYPGDFRWVCGLCRKRGAWVQPRIDAKCMICEAKVVRLIRQNSLGQVQTQRYNGIEEIVEDFEYQDGGEQKKTTKILRPTREQIDATNAFRQMQAMQNERYEAIRLRMLKQQMNSAAPGTIEISPEDMKRLQNMYVNSTKSVKTGGSLSDLEGSPVLTPKGIGRVVRGKVKIPEKPKPDLLPEPGRRKFRVAPDDDE